ncbi:MAG: DNA-3-methyladenine glycosylase I [Pseudomonadales bacterium]|nr:DNA-3-methyladenine glycosylase I [Pseudomonadales bacterium]
MQYICPDEIVAEDSVLALDDNQILSALSKKVFQSGFVWRVVEKKWPGFEELFWQFDVDKLLMMPDEMLERKAKDPSIIRNLKKVWTIRDNAQMIASTRQREGCSFAEFIDRWPNDDIIHLWQYLKQHGSRLGGNTGPYALRAIGKDSFLLTRDVELYLRHAKVIDSGLYTKRALNQTQQFFNQLQQQSGWHYQQLSQLVACCAGENRTSS